jgi:hypothetical protein
MLNAPGVQGQQLAQVLCPKHTLHSVTGNVTNQNCNQSVHHTDDKKAKISSRNIAGGVAQAVRAPT